eukprot:3875393-Amphidinium_carterae.1
MEFDHYEPMPTNKQDSCILPEMQDASTCWLRVHAFRRHEASGWCPRGEKLNWLLLLQDELIADHRKRLREARH